MRDCVNGGRTVALALLDSVAWEIVRVNAATTKQTGRSHLDEMAGREASRKVDVAHFGGASSLPRSLEKNHHIVCVDRSYAYLSQHLDGVLTRDSHLIESKTGSSSRPTSPEPRSPWLPLLPLLASA
jgi:hypothetical protein